jgi:hypothetical protein
MSSDRWRRLPLAWLAGVGLAFGAGAAWSAARRSPPTTLTLERHADNESQSTCRAALLMTAFARASTPPLPATVASDAAPAAPAVSSGAGEASGIDDTAAQAAFFAAVAAAHDADTVDHYWSRRLEDEIGQLVGERAPALALDRVDCRSRTCVAHLHAATHEGSSDALEDLVSRLNSGFSDVSVDLQPSGALTVYLSRAGVPPVP